MHFSQGDGVYFSFMPPINSKRITWSNNFDFETSKKFHEQNQASTMLSPWHPLQFWPKSSCRTIKQNWHLSELNVAGGGSFHAPNNSHNVMIRLKRYVYLLTQLSKIYITIFQHQLFDFINVWAVFKRLTVKNGILKLEILQKEGNLLPLFGPFRMLYIIHIAVFFFFLHTQFTVRSSTTFPVIRHAKFCLKHKI